MESSSYNLTTLSNNPEYFEEVISLIEREFHYENKGKTLHYEKDFAPLMDPTNFDNCYLYIDTKNNSVASHLALCPRLMIKNNISLPIGLIGGIATAPEHRGKNLFKNLMNHALEEHSLRCGLFILWSDIQGLYEKFSFYLTGGLIETGQSILTPNDRPIGFEKISFPELNEEEFNSIKDIYQNFNQKYFFTICRTEKDWSIIKGMSSIDVFIKKNENGKIIQYYCVNKGKDLADIIHEIGTYAEDYLSMIKNIQRFKVWLPESELSISQRKDIFFTAFMKVGDPKILGTFLAELSNNQLVLKNKKEKNISIEFNGNHFDFAEKDFLQYLFGPKPLKEFENLLLSPYICGTDSI